MSHSPSDQELVRREALKKLRDLGIEPYPAAGFNVSTTAEEIKRTWTDPPPDNPSSAPETTEAAKPIVSIAGRIMSIRVMGKASFAVLRDHTGDIQIYIARDEIAPGEDKTMYDQVWKHLLHLGDHIGARNVDRRHLRGG